jgi:hypothetical protein
MFLWCPEAAYSAEARVLGAQVAARVRCAYRIAPAVLDRLCERERPDADAARWLRERGFGIFLATVGAGATPYSRPATGGGPRPWSATSAPASRSTGMGTPRELTIPMHGRADSLNVAVSASILMYDICARREDQRAGLRLPAVSGAARAGP